MASAHLLLSLQTIISRNVDPLDAAVISIARETSVKRSEVSTSPSSAVWSMAEPTSLPPGTHLHRGQTVGVRKYC